ncbi:MAG: 1-acyl-sn-glycerol-3-phosphate acyltransferase [Calditrichaeota bacterium]|nr:MAG: 1-acyl-sn-glycerol-3-phosphate acyltransferase [Calditrichota bacterium]
MNSAYFRDVLRDFRLFLYPSRLIFCLSRFAKTCEVNEIDLTREQLRLLTFVERINFTVVHWLNRSRWLSRPLLWLQSHFSRWWVELASSKTVRDHGFENFARLDPGRGVLLVANHRTFYDQFVIAARLFTLYGSHHHICFPVRANFFYDSPLALPVNLLVSFGVMYPPIIRDKKRLRWNKFATDLLVELLKDPGNMVGFHPEGTRNRGPNPYELLPAKPGCGELIYRARPNVVPVFLQGFPASPLKMFRANWRASASDKPFVHMVMGEPMTFEKELQMEESKKTFLLISRKVMQRIAELGEVEREIRSRVETQAVTREPAAHVSVKS